jgi:hypothetical protein
MSDAAAVARPASNWEDLLEIFYAPSRVFTRRQGGGFVVPLAVLTVVMVALFYATMSAIQPVFDAEFTRGMAAAMRANPKLTPEMIESMKGTNMKFGGAMLLFFVPITVMLVGLSLWLIGKAVDAKEALSAAVMVATFAYYPRIVEMLANAVQALMLPEESIRGRASVSRGLARFMDPDAASPLAMAMALRVDLFTIWITVLLAIGLRVTGRVSGAQAAGVAALVWLVGALPGVLGALR